MNGETNSMRHPPAGRRRSLRGGGLLVAACLALVACQGCIKVQRAAGCNNPGILGCKDKPAEQHEPEPGPAPAN